MWLTAALALVLLPAAAGADPAGEDRALFEEYCAACHGEMGRGDGPRAAALRARPADLTRLAGRYGRPLPRPALLAAILGHDRRSTGPCRDRSLAWKSPSAGRTIFLRGIGSAALRFAETLGPPPAEPDPAGSVPPPR